MNILLIHGPNLHLLGQRQPEIYGSQTLADIDQHLMEVATQRNVNLKIFQSNHEGEIVTTIGQHIDWADGILINPAAYTHTSVAIRDALATIGLPVIELHLSNVHGRESFRHHSYIAPIAMGTIAGFGAFSYDLAIEAMIQHLNVAQT
ncbi:type II 3-dehydroquinate dehydratase [Candidatus Poribacteria bacterium]|nr:type II 3-dehydroquinate dehydratase [Candidatus Poribacteria bacterium]|tara:strand:- start:93 stop:536 length:444 start_codon:yes stop_codon:yes gene_type:complete